MNNQEKPYFKGSQSVVKTDSLLPLDNDWVRSSFLISLDDFPSPKSIVTDRYVLKYIYWTRTSLKFTNTTMGGNLGVNSKPQFCRYSDIRVKGLLPGRNEVSINNTLGNNGMGSYYSEAFDDNAQRIYLRFGVPQFNSLLNFMTTMFDANLSSLANTGSSPSLLYWGTRLLVGAGTFIYFFPMSAIFLAGQAVLSTLVNKSISSFYSMKPAMPLYWSAVNEMVNTISVLRGILPPSMMDSNRLSPGDSDYKYNKDILDSMKEIMPDVINDQYGIDVFAMQNRVQLIQNKINSLYDSEATKDITDPLFGDDTGNVIPTDDYINKATSTIAETNKTSDKNSLGYIVGVYQNTIGAPPVTSSADASQSPNMLMTLNPDKVAASMGANNVSAALDQNGVTTTATQQTDATQAYASAPDSNGSNGGAGVNEVFGSVSDKLKGYTQTDAEATYIDKNSGPFSKVWEYFKAEGAAGGGYACFVVEHTGSVSDSFSNDFQQSQLAGFLNSMSSSARAVTFNIADGNIIPGMDTLIGAAKNVVSGALDGLNLGGIARLILGSYMVDVPKFWSGSTASLGKTDYTLDLVSPYGNAMSQMQNLYIPLSMILVGGLPLSAGRQAYTSPFLCQLFDRGRTQVTLGMIDSISVTRGTTNLPFNREFRPLSLKVSFSVLNLNNIMHVPITKGTFFNNVKAYIATTAADSVRNLSSSLSSGAGDNLKAVLNSTGDTGANIVGSFLATSLTDDDGILFNYLSSVAGVSAKDSLYRISRARLSLAIAYKSAATLSSPAAWANRLTGVLNNTFGFSTAMNIWAGVSNAAILTAPVNNNAPAGAKEINTFPG